MIHLSFPMIVSGLVVTGRACLDIPDEYAVPLERFAFTRHTTNAELARNYCPACCEILDRWVAARDLFFDQRLSGKLPKKNRP